jgi:hypothetical protein
MEALEVLKTREMQHARRAVILRMQSAIEQSARRVPAEHCPVQHFFAPGQYAREITMPADMVVVGKIHKHAHVNVISRGHVLVFTEHEGLQELIAPVTFVSSPGTKRVVHTLEETVWTTVHSTDKTDIAEIEREIIAEDYSEVLP